MSLARILSDSRLMSTLEAIDFDLADRTRKKRCPYCGGPLHVGNYWRNSSGPPQLDPSRSLRFSFCCGNEGCRRRTTPPSVRFLGRRGYLGILVVLVSAMAEKLTGKWLKKLRKVFEINRRTILRWRRWWHEIFPPLFDEINDGRIQIPIAAAQFPGALVKHFDAFSCLDNAVRLLEFITPLGALPDQTGTGFFSRRGCT